MTVLCRHREAREQKAAVVPARSGGLVLGGGARDREKAVEVSEFPSAFVLILLTQDGCQVKADPHVYPWELELIWEKGHNNSTYLIKLFEDLVSIVPTHTHTVLKKKKCVGHYCNMR